MSNGSLESSDSGVSPDGELTIPENVDGEIVVNENDYGMLKIHAHNGAQRQADGAGAYAENLRYDYLEGKNSVSFAESTGVRHVEESGSGRHRDIGSGT